MVIVQPKPGKWLAGCCLALGNFVGMMHGYVLDAACVNVGSIAKILHSHRRTFDMPARKALSPRTIPFHITLAIFGAEFP